MQRYPNPDKEAEKKKRKGKFGLEGKPGNEHRRTA
jgi:hypothetical protein